MTIAPFALERYFARHEFSARHLLCASDCQSMSIGELLALEPGARERFERHWLGYTESQGSPSLREAVSGLYGSIAPAQVLVHSGAEEAIFLFMHALLGPGDHVIVHCPCYQSLVAVPWSIGCRVSRWEAREPEGWALDPRDLERLIRPDTKAIVINTPHNPTGYLMPREVFRDVCGIAEEKGIVLFSDEVYRESEYDPGDRLPAACDVWSGAVSLGVLSKTYGLPGLRIGWIATRNTDLLSRMAGLKDYTTICASAPSEFLAELALRHRGPLVERSVGTLKRNLEVVEGFFTRHEDAFHWRRPKAGPIAFPRMLSGSGFRTVDELCERLVEQSGVLLLPGSVYEDKGNHFRIGFGRDDLPQALAGLEAFLASHPA